MRLTGMVGLAGLYCLAPCVQAQDTAVLPAAVVTGNYDNQVGSTDAASAGSVTSKLIERRPALRPGEILEFVPGVIVTQHSGDGKANQYFLRGFNLDHGTDFATTVDGMPVNMRSHAHGQGYTDLNFVIPELISRIDYRKGPYSAEDGDFANAGSARMHLFNGLPEGIAALTLGQNGYARSLLADSLDSGAGRWLYALELGHNDGPWSVSENLRKYNGVLRYSQGTEQEGWRVMAAGYESQWRATDQVPQRAIEAGLIDRFGTLDDSDGGKTARYSLSASADGRLGAGRYSASAYAIRSRLNLYSNFTYFLEHPSDLGDAINGDQFEQAENRRVLGFDLKYAWPAQWGAFDVLNTVGLQGRQDKIGPLGLYATEAHQRAATTREDQVREGSLGLWVENQTEWQPWLRSVAGLRLDRYRFKVDSNLAENSGTTSDQIVSPKLSLIFGPWQRTEFFLNAGQGFHSNDARGTVQQLSPKTLTAVDPVTPLVRTRGEEIGVRSEWLPGLQSSLALWQLRSASELVFVGDAGETEATRPSKRYGVEWNNHYIINPQWLFDADLAWSHARYRDDAPEGNYIPGAIETVVSMGLSMVRLGPWSGQFQLRYFGPRPLIEDNSVRSSSTTLAYLRVGYALSKTTQLSLDIFNLFDRQASDIDYYYASRLQGEAADGVEDIHSHPVEPRSIRLSLVHRF